MRYYTLLRWAHTDHGVLGRMGNWHTLENPWRGNERGVSCIPTGTYRCVRSYYHAGGYEAFHIVDVPGRSRILIHVGNTETDTRGCPLVGKRVGVLAGKIAVLQSKAAHDEMMRELEGFDEFELTVRNVYA